MSGYTGKIAKYVSTVPANVPIEVGRLYKEAFSDIPETAFYKTIERLAKKGELQHLTKGLYYRPRLSRFGSVPISEEEISDFYMREGRGMLIGYRLYNKLGLTTQVGKGVEVLSNALNGNIKNIGKVCVKRAEIELNSNTIPVIEMLEVLQNYYRIEELNNERLAAYFHEFSERYSDAATCEVLASRKYKKATIAFLKELLDYHNIPNSLGKYLSALSKYAIPSVEDIYETA